MSETDATFPFTPNDALKVFEPFLGTWKTTGTHGMIPDTTLHGRTTFSWHESGGFIVVESTIYEDVGIPAGVALIGSDGSNYEMLYYDVRGVSRHYRVSIQGNVLKWWREAPEFSQRNTLTLSDDGHTIVGNGEISKDGITWEQDLNLTYAK